MNITTNYWLAGALMLLAGVALFGFTWLMDKWNRAPRDADGLEPRRCIVGGFGLVFASFGWVLLLMLAGAMLVLPLVLRLWHFASQ
jgi:MFS family permease